MAKQPVLHNISADLIEQMVCKCGFKLFAQVFLVGYLSEIVSPTGQAMFIPEARFACAQCGELLPSLAQQKKIREEKLEKDRKLQ